MEIVHFYRAKDKPVIFEFGTGASTLWHVTELLQKESGTYVGVESDPSWFWPVVAAILKKTIHASENVSTQVIHPSSNIQENIDVEIFFGNVKISLRLRPSLEDYLHALDLPCDVIVVDGISRKQCVQTIVASSYLKTGCMLMLMEAGRGSDRWWQGKLNGDADYSAELQTLLSLGGELLDGTGLDNWPGCTKRSPRPVSYYYPMEACRLIIP
jgi:hypothetical protein